MNSFKLLPNRIRYRHEQTNCSGKTSARYNHHYARKRTGESSGGVRGDDAPTGEKVS